MGKKRLIFYSIFGAYQMVAFIFTVVINYNPLIMLNMVSYVNSFKFISFLGVLLVIVDFAWSWRLSSKARKEADEYRLENNTLKARIYDFQQNKEQTIPAGTK